jgi:hypothetical protein
MVLVDGDSDRMQLIVDGVVVLDKRQTDGIVAQL